MPSFDASKPAPATGPARASRTLTGWLLRSCFWLGCLALIGAAVAIGSGWQPWRAAAVPVPSGPRRIARPPVADPLAAAARRAARSVVSIQTVGQGNTRNLGAGFVVDVGLVATSYHVVASATEAQVRFVDGRVFAIAGYAAVDPAHDLALLRVAALPNDIAPLVLAEQDLEVATKVMAIGHPRGVEFAFVEGRISQRVATAALPADSQRFLRKLTGTSEDLRWLQHTADLDAGNSGGPLVDATGQVVGINTWMNRETNTHYALEVRHLRALLARASDETQPLEALAKTEVQVAAMVSRLSAARLEALFAEGERIGWIPASRDDYRSLSELALAMTAAHLPQTFRGDKFDEERAHDLEVAATRIEQKLRTRPQFGAPDQITIVNEQAAQVLAKPHTGVFLFAEVERVVEGDRGQRGMLMQLIGDEQSLFVSLDGQLLNPEPGEVYAVFGANLRGDVVRYGDNPLRLETAPVIVSRTFLPIVSSGVR